MPGAEIRGRVTSDAGTPVEGATVMIRSSSVGHHDIAALTDAQGQFSFRGVQPGDYDLQAFGEEGGSGNASTSVAADAPGDVVIVLGNSP